MCEGYRVKKSLNMEKNAFSNDRKMEQILEKRITKLEAEVKELKEKLVHTGMESKTVIIDDTISYDEVKRRVYEFTNKHPDKDYDSFQLMEELHLDPELIEKALWALQKEGKLQ